MPWSDFLRRNSSVKYPDYDDDDSQKTIQGDPRPDSQISNDQRQVQDYRKSQRQCKDLQRRLEESTKQREYLERRLDSQESRIQKLGETLNSCREEVGVSKMGRLCAEEKLRRQTQLLEECRAALDASLGENSSLVIQQAALRKWTDRLDDNEARYMMGQLYHDLEGWIRRYFPYLSPGNQASNINPHGLLIDESNRLERFYRIYDLVSYTVFRVFLTRIMVGIDDSDFGNKVSMLDRHIRAECPIHVAQHWRSAMNIATSALFCEDRDSDCKRIAMSMEDLYEFNSCRDSERRTDDLQNLLARFARLKFRFDSQADLYTFTWKESGTPFNENEMADLTGQCSESGVVQFCLSPALYKESKGCGPILITKANVILYMDLQYPGAGISDPDGTVFSHDVKMSDN